MSLRTNENYGRHLSRSAGRKRARRRRRRTSTLAVSMLILCTVIMVSAIASALELCMPDAFADVEVMYPLISAKPIDSPASQLTPSPAPEAEGDGAVQDSSASQGSSTYDYSQPVPQSTAVDNSYFDDAVFIGDSRTEGMITATGLYNATAFTHQGLTVDTAFKDLVVCIDGQYYTVVDALNHSSFNKVYIMLGINETGWIYSSKFIEGYGKIIDAVRAANPDAQIYIQEILPVSNSVSSTHDYIKNSKIDEYNQLLQQLAEEKQVYFVDTASSVAAQDGSLPEDAAVDGIHMKNSYCQRWLDYLKSHTVS